MPTPGRRVRLHALLCVFLLAACTPPAVATPDTAALTAAVEAAQTTAAQQAKAAADQANTEEARVATGIAATLTAQPTATSTHTTVPSDTPTATDTAQPTATDTPAATPTDTATPRPTSPPVSPTASPAPIPASVYGETGGPDGYFTDIECFRGSAPCSPSMPPGDINFTFYLASGPLTPLTLFETYGLAVEKDGANVPNMFMFVDAGLLDADIIVRFGASRNFTAPGRYVIRSSGCMTTVPAPCGWQTMAGTTVTFVIAP